VKSRLYLLSLSRYLLKRSMTYDQVSRGKLVQKDTVCGMMVDEKKTKLTSSHDGTAFYFCSQSCKNTFDRDPHKYDHSH